VDIVDSRDNIQKVLQFSRLCESGDLGGIVEPYVNDAAHASVLQVGKELFGRLLGKTNSK